VKVLKHSEPILLLGIPESALLNFNDQYLGKSVADKIEVGPSRPDEDVIGLDAISGATVTVIAQNQVMMVGPAVARRSASCRPRCANPARFAVAGKRCPLGRAGATKGAVQRLVVQPEQVGLPPGPEPFIELWFGDLNHPDLGRACWATTAGTVLRLQLKDGEHALLHHPHRGAESFKGSGFVRGGIYDRVQVKQGATPSPSATSTTSTSTAWRRQARRRYNESAIFIIRSGSFSAAYPWKLSFLGNRVDRATGQRSFASFERLLAARRGSKAAARRSRSPSTLGAHLEDTCRGDCACSHLLLVAVTVVYAFAKSSRACPRTRTSGRSTASSTPPGRCHLLRRLWPAGAALHHPGADLVPLAAVPVDSGRCSCPTRSSSCSGSSSSSPCSCSGGACSAAGCARSARCRRGSSTSWRASWASSASRPSCRRWHDRLKWVKYAIFFGLLGVSMFSMGLAEKLAEVEPFKTTFLVGVMNRAWPYGLFVAPSWACRSSSSGRYCKYICPLGAALAMPSTFRWFGLQAQAGLQQLQGLRRGLRLAGHRPMAASTTASACTAWTAWCSTPTPRAARRWPRSASAASAMAWSSRPSVANGYFIPIHPVA
jgi:NosR/NirI family nitrous oxide reductase transcriptional regulator